MASIQTLTLTVGKCESNGATLAQDSRAALFGPRGADKALLGPGGRPCASRRRANLRAGTISVSIQSSVKAAAAASNKCRQPNFRLLRRSQQHLRPRRQRRRRRRNKQVNASAELELAALFLSASMGSLSSRTELGMESHSAILSCTLLEQHDRTLKSTRSGAGWLALSDPARQRQSRGWSPRPR